MKDSGAVLLIVLLVPLPADSGAMPFRSGGARCGESVEPANSRLFAVMAPMLIFRQALEIACLIVPAILVNVVDIEPVRDAASLCFPDNAMEPNALPLEVPTAPVKGDAAIPLLGF